jgi:hypothetical protein
VSTGDVKSVLSAVEKMSLIETSCRLESGVSCDDDDDVSTKAGFEKRS